MTPLLLEQSNTENEFDLVELIIEIESRKLKRMDKRIEERREVGRKPHVYMCERRLVVVVLRRKGKLLFM